MTKTQKKCPFSGRLCETVDCGLWSSDQRACGLLLAAEAINLIEERLETGCIDVAVY
jgi:hypothetical protein